MKNKFVKVGTFILDVALSEEHTFESDVTEYPVESGGSFTDNIRPKPMRLSLKGVVTNTPISTNVIHRSKVSEFATSFGETINPFTGFGVTSLRSDQAYAYLRQIWLSRDVVSISTSLGTFPEMALVSLTIPRNKSTGDALEFTAQFQQIQKVTNNRLKSSTGKNKRGPKGTLDTGGTGLIKWRRGAPPGGEAVFDVVYVEYRVIKGRMELWFPDRQPVNLYDHNQTTTYGNVFLSEPFGVVGKTDKGARKLTPSEMKAFEMDQKRDADAKRKKDFEAYEKYEAELFKPKSISQITRKSQEDQSARERKYLPNGSGLSPLKNAFSVFIPKKPGQ